MAVSMLDDDAKGGRGGKRGGPIDPGHTGKPRGMDYPPHGTFPLVHEHPTGKLGRGAGKHGSGGGMCGGMKGDGPM